MWVGVDAGVGMQCVACCFSSPHLSAAYPSDGHVRVSCSPPFPFLRPRALSSRRRRNIFDGIAHDAQTASSSTSNTAGGGDPNASQKRRRLLLSSLRQGEGGKDSSKGNSSSGGSGKAAGGAVFGMDAHPAFATAVRSESVPRVGAAARGGDVLLARPPVSVCVCVCVCVCYMAVDLLMLLPACVWAISHTP